MGYKKLWTDMHSNIHHEKMEDLEKWFLHVKEIMDFWPIAYYPFHMRRTPDGAGLEDVHSPEKRDADWEKLRAFTEKVNNAGYPMFMGYEWQGSGKDGDHNVFFLNNDQMMQHPLRYEELYDYYRDKDAIAIPHHLAYQPGSRGKNWDTHNEEFTPFAEIYSSHGSSENDYGPLAMNRHIHMGPRTGVSVYERGLDRGFLTGVIASGDNHSVPAVSEHGSMCVLAEAADKESIWAAMKARRTYGVSKSRIAVDMEMNGAPMGAVIAPGKAEMKVSIRGTDAIDRVEILRDNVVEEMVVHSGTWERQAVPERMRLKFMVSFGWGPDTRIFKDIVSKVWSGRLETEGKLLAIEKCWNSFGQSLSEVTDHSCEFELTTYKSTTSGKWMGPSNVVTEGFIFEVEVTSDEAIVLTVDGREYRFAAADLMQSSAVYPFYEESEKRIMERWPDAGHYRDDLIWHNAYKFKISQAVPEAAYSLNFNRTYQTAAGENYRLRIWQKNGDAAWTSPVFIREEA